MRLFGTMRGSLRVVPALLLLLAALSGCVDGDELETSEEGRSAAGAQVDEDTGSVAGVVLTADLYEVKGGSVRLLKDEKVVKETTTADDGTYSLNKVPPGDYVLMVDADCCHPVSKRVSVEAGAVVKHDLQVEPAASEEGYYALAEWTGFISCGASVVARTVAICSAAGDPNDDFTESFRLDPSLTTLIIGMAWDTTPFSSDELLLIIDRCKPGNCREYERVTGESPLITTLERSEITHEDFKFQNYEDDWRLRLRVFTPFPVGVTYQQSFDVYLHQFHNMETPDDLQVIPDR